MKSGKPRNGACMPVHNRAESSSMQALYRRLRRTKSQGRLRDRAQRPLPILGACIGEVRGSMARYRRNLLPLRL